MSPVYKFSNVGGFLTKNLYTSALAGNAVVQLDKGSMDPIGAVTVPSGGLAAVEFTNIPSTYQHLQVRAFVQAEVGGSTFTVLSMLINSNNLTKNHYLYGNGASALGGVGAVNTVMNIPQSGYTNIFAGGIIDILDYTNTNKNKTIRTLSGVDANGAGEIVLYSNLYSTNTNAITSLLFRVDSGTTDIGVNSSFALYGIKA